MAERKRQVVLDTETTGLEPSQGHRIIEIGCVEMVNRRLTGKRFHQYINPNRDIDEGAIAVHGITNEFLENKPDFSAVKDDFLAFVGEAELVIHNAPFDVGFIDHELLMLDRTAQSITACCSIIDTLPFARKKHPGMPNSLDALCRRYGVDNSNRELHGALLDAEILADVYLIMTGGQNALFQVDNKGDTKHEGGTIKRVSGSTLPVVKASVAELAAHQAFIDNNIEGERA